VVRRRPHRPIVYAICRDSTVELYDRIPSDADAVRLADFRLKDWEALTGLLIPRGLVCMVRLSGEFARHR
jgi:hypothetical protein